MGDLSQDDLKTILWQICEDFVKENKIRCPETIYQMNHVIRNAYEFIEEVADLVGYLPDDGE